MHVAITRRPSRSIERCELSFQRRASIDFERLAEQHARYEQALRQLGCGVTQLVEEPEYPDSVFVEDGAVVLDELAVLARPGAPSRRGEVPSIAEALAPYRTGAVIREPATLDGGDVLVVGRRVFVGLSRRTNHAAVEQLRELLMPHGYSVEAVHVLGCLHLKSAATCVGATTVLVQPRWLDGRPFRGLETIEVDPREPHAANTLIVGDTLLVPSAFPRTAERLSDRGLDLRTVDVSEVAKAEGALTCCSLLFEVPGEETPDAS